MRVIAFAVAVCFCSYRRCYTHAKAFSLFNHCSFSESKYNCKSCGKGQARSCNRPDDKQCFFVKSFFALWFFFRKISLRYLPVVLLQEWIRSWWFALMVSLWLEGAGWRWLLMNVGWDFAKSRISWKPTKSRFFKKLTKSRIPENCGVLLTLCPAAGGLRCCLCCVRVCVGDRQKKRQVQDFPKKRLSPDFVKTH